MPDPSSLSPLPQTLRGLVEILGDSEENRGKTTGLRDRRDSWELPDEHDTAFPAIWAPVRQHTIVPLFRHLWSRLALPPKKPRNTNKCKVYEEKWRQWTRGIQERGCYMGMFNIW